MSPRGRFAIAAAVVGASVLGLIAWSLSGSTAYYRTPSELRAGATPAGDRVRVAGKVVPETIDRDGKTTTFSVSDGKATLPVTTEALLPDTFGSNVEVVVEGGMTKRGVFSASTVLAKCPSKFKAKLQQPSQA
ncbi:MAG: cytochrome c maturation protein CcmE [Actinomycetota bacterium]